MTTKIDTTPIVLLDVDGVLNAVWQLDLPEGVDGRFTVGEANGYTIVWDQAVTDRLINMHDTGKIEIRWHTTWQDTANKFISPLLGWPELSVVPGEMHYHAGWWKHDPGIKIIETEGRPVIWIDDDHGTSWDTQEWLDANSDRHHVKIISPDCTQGITMDDLDDIEAWIASL